MLELFMMQKIPSSKIESSYLHVAPEELLSSIDSNATDYRKMEVIFDNEQTEALAGTLQLCYPQGVLTKGEYFSRFSLSNSALGQLNCSFATMKIEPEGDNSFSWEIKNGTTQRLEALCETRQTDLEWIEAENIPMANGWQTETNFAPGWSGTGFAMDNYGSGSLYTKLDTDLSHRSYIWVRYYKRESDQTPTYLTVNNIAYPIADVNEADLNVWKWERVGPVKFDGAGELSINRKYTDDPQYFMAIFIDSLIITQDANFSPATDLWKPMPPKIFSFKVRRR